jgi:hypothetical protein
MCIFYKDSGERPRYVASDFSNHAMTMNPCPDPMNAEVAAQHQCVFSLDDLPAHIVHSIRALLFNSSGCLRRDINAGIPGTLADIIFPYEERNDGVKDTRWQIVLPRENNGELYIHCRARLYTNVTHLNMSV